MTPKSPPPSPLRRRTFRATAVILGMIGALVMVELALRLAGISYPIFHQVDEIAGLRLIPGASGRYTQEGDAFVRINREGWRDVERTKEKPPDVFRIAVLGDSFTEALQVNLEQTFVRRLQDLLADCPALRGRRVEVLNFGVSGYGTAQQLITLRHHVWDYSPDAVLLAMLPGNDVTDNRRSLKRIDYIPYFVYEGEKLKLDDSFKESDGYRRRRSLGASALLAMSRHSRVLQAANHVRQLWRRSSRVEKGAEGAVGWESGLTDKIYCEPSEPELAEAWRVTEGLLRLMSEESRTRGVLFMLTILPAGLQVHPDPQVRADYAVRLGTPDFFYAERRLEALAGAAGFPALSLAPPMQKRAQGEKVFFHGFDGTRGTGHWNADGHAAAAALIAPWVCGELARR